MNEHLTSEELLERLATLCVEKRGENVVALDVRELVDYMDYLLIVTGRSRRQNRAIAENVTRALKASGVHALSRAGLEPGSWICLDFVDVVLHIFDEPTRTHYDLELLWADAKPVTLDLPTPAPLESFDDESQAEEGVVEPPPRAT